MLGATIEGAINGVLNSIGHEKLSVLIENDRNILECIFGGMIKPPERYYSQISKEEVRKIEAMRRSISRTVLPILEMARRVASRFPPEAVEAKVTGEWLLGKGKQKFPQLVKLVEKYGERGIRWVEKQAEQIRGYLTGKLVFNPYTMRMETKEEVNEFISKLAEQNQREDGADG